jgi:hypothetical protein
MARGNAGNFGGKQAKPFGSKPTAPTKGAKPPKGTKPMKGKSGC